MNYFHMFCFEWVKYRDKEWGYILEKNSYIAIDTFNIEYNILPRQIPYMPHMWVLYKESVFNRVLPWEKILSQICQNNSDCQSQSWTCVNEFVWLNTLMVHRDVLTDSEWSYFPWKYSDKYDTKSVSVFRFFTVKCHINKCSW